MGVRERQRAVREMRGQMWSPGRPSTARREDRQRFWLAIAAGWSSEEAAAAAGVSQADCSRGVPGGGGGAPTFIAPLTGGFIYIYELGESTKLLSLRARVREIS